MRLDYFTKSGFIRLSFQPYPSIRPPAASTGLNIKKNKQGNVFEPLLLPRTPVTVLTKGWNVHTHEKRESLFFHIC